MKVETAQRFSDAYLDCVRRLGLTTADITVDICGNPLEPTVRAIADGIDKGSIRSVLEQEPEPTAAEEAQYLAALRSTASVFRARLRDAAKRVPRTSTGRPASVPREQEPAVCAEIEQLSLTCDRARAIERVARKWNVVPRTIYRILERAMKRRETSVTEL